jgi:hypothetical protein
MRFVVKFQFVESGLNPGSLATTCELFSLTRLLLDVSVGTQEDQKRSEQRRSCQRQGAISDIESGQTESTI